MDETKDPRVTRYWHWYGPATFLNAGYEGGNFGDVKIGLIGVPYSGGNSVERMQYLGPRSIRNRSMAYRRYHREFQFNPFDVVSIRDLGDAPMPRVLHPDLAAKDFEEFFLEVFNSGVVPVSIGGDHSITWPILRARKTRFRSPVGMIHFDSHTDAVEAGFGTRNHAAGFRLGAEDGLIEPKRTVQLGIRGPVADKTQDEWALKNFKVITTNEIVTRGVAEAIGQVRRIIGTGPAYLSFDLDVLDPAYAPGVADPEVNGLTMREITELIHGLRGLNLIGADIVCYCPPLDNPSEITALTASSLLLDMVCLIAERLRPNDADAREGE